jgi:hypothetical protein
MLCNARDRKSQEGLLNDIATLVVAPSDLHCGSQVGLLPPSWTLPDASVVHANPLQEILYRQWCEGWARVGELRKHARRMLVINVGDAVEGDHHDTVELVTPRIDVQERIHVAVMQDGLVLGGFNPSIDKLRYIGGTDTHVGEGSSSEERILRALVTSTENSADKVHDGYLGDIDGQLFDIAHHGPRVGGRLWTRESSMRSYFYNEYLSRLERGERIPRVFLRGHGHQFGHTTITRQDGSTVSDTFLLPAFCFKGDYAHKVAYDSLAQIGLWIGIIGMDGSFTWECPMLSERQTKITVE